MIHEIPHFSALMRKESKATFLIVGNHFRSDKSNLNVWHELPVRLAGCDWDTLVTSRKRPRVLRLADMLWTIYIQRSRYDLALVDLFSGSAFMWGELSVMLLRQLNKTIVLTLHGGNLPVFAQRYPKRIHRVLTSACVVVAPSAYLQSQLSLYRNDIRVIPNPIDVSAYPFRHRTNPKPNLVWVRAFHEIYNPSLAPKMLHELIKTWPEAHLTMVGPDKSDSSLERMQMLATQLSVKDHVTITGGVAREQVPNWLDQGDIFINTTNFDNTPVSVIEAMACGLPVVTTNVGGIPWLIEDGVDGLLVPPDDPESIAQAIHRVLTEPGLAGNLSQNARQKAESFDWLIILPVLEEVLTSLVQN